MSESDYNLTCPVPLNRHKRILLAHGSGGALTHELIDKVFAPAFDNPFIRQHHDGAVADLPAGKLAITTDSYVVRPLFFPGGDIGRLAVYGSVNDLAMCGARPLYLSVAFILEEGFEIAQLVRIVDSMKKAADQCGVKIITGDTKVVDKGKGDGVFINTTGVGVIGHGLSIIPASIREGDAIILSGDIGRHGVAVMLAREGLSMESSVESDAAPLADSVLELIERGIKVHCLRDLTRGGLATALVELAQGSGSELRVSERDISVSPPVRGACEVLGLDPLYVANEGRFVCIAPASESAAVLEVLKRRPGGDNAGCIGIVARGDRPQAILENAIGTSRVLHMLPGELLPRIC